MRAQMQKLMGMMQGQEAIAGMGDLVDSLNADEKVRTIASGSVCERGSSCEFCLGNLQLPELLVDIVQAPLGTARRRRRRRRQVA